MITEELFRELLDVVRVLAVADPSLRRRLIDIQTALDERRSLSLVRRERHRTEASETARNVIDAVYPNGSD
jgi:hypothetical protein